MIRECWDVESGIYWSLGPYQVWRLAYEWRTRNNLNGADEEICCIASQVLQETV